MSNDYLVQTLWFQTHIVKTMLCFPQESTAQNLPFEEPAQQAFPLGVLCVFSVLTAQILGQGRKKPKRGRGEERKETLSSPFPFFFFFFSLCPNFREFTQQKTHKTPTKTLDTQATNLNGHTLGFRSDPKLQAMLDI